MAYDLKSFAKLSFDDQMDEFERLEESGEVDSDTLDAVQNIIIDGIGSEAAEDDSSGVKGGYPFGGLSYFIQALPKAGDGGHVMSMGGIALRFGVYMLVFFASMCIQVVAALHYRVLDFKGVWMVLPFFGGPDESLDGAGALVIFLSLMIPIPVCMVLAAFTRRLRMLMPLLSLWFVVVLGACSGAFIATIVAWAVEPSGEWFYADGLENRLLDGDGIGYQWPELVLCVVLFVVSLVVGWRNRRRPMKEGGWRDALGSGIGSLALILILFSRDHGITTLMVWSLAVVVAVGWIPGEFKTCVAAIDDGRDAAYEWDMAFWPWLELFIVFGLCVTGADAY
jgi:hypothetical protein